MSDDREDEEMFGRLDAHIETESSRPDEPPDETAAVRDAENGVQLAGALFTLCERRFKFWTNADGEVIVDVEEGVTRKTMPLDSKAFTNVIRRIYHGMTGNVLRDETVKQVITMLEAANEDAQEIVVAKRVHRMGNRIYLDMCDERWRAIEVDRNGWRIVKKVEGFRFKRSRIMNPLPEPQEGGSIEPFLDLLNLEDDDAKLSVTLTLLSFLGNGPYPITNINGPEGSSKTKTTEFIAELIDPLRVKTRAMPKKEDDLAVAANDCFIVRVDNVSYLPNDLSDILCGMATGTTMTRRKLYSNGEAYSITVCQPLAMNGIPSFAERADFADRSLPVLLEPLDGDRRKTRAQVDAMFDGLRATTLGALLDIASHGLRHEADFEDAKLPRMADAAKWWFACSGAIPWLGKLKGPKAVAALMEAKDLNSAVAMVEGSYAARLTLTFLDSLKPREGLRPKQGDWEIEMEEDGTLSLRIAHKVLFEELVAMDQAHGTAHANDKNRLAGSPNHYSGQLGRMRVSLGRVGVGWATILPKGLRTHLIRWKPQDVEGFTFKF